MDIRLLADMINDKRDADVLVGLNSGKEMLISPDARAFLWEEVTLMVIWPLGDDITKVRRVVNIAPSNVATAEYAHRAGEDAA